MADKIQLRRGSRQEWEQRNPVLDQGEPGLEEISGAASGHNMKIGDGNTPWNDLPYHVLGDASQGPASSFYQGEVIGVCLTMAGGGAGEWAHVDALGNKVRLGQAYFSGHPVYGGIRTVSIDGQYMVEIPAFYVSNFVPEDGPCARRPCFLISPEARDGFRLHPAFMKNGEPVSRFYVGAHPGSVQNNKLCSQAQVMPTEALTAQLRSYAAARNTSGVEGFALWDVYQRAALQWLFLVEFASSDSRAIFPNMGCGSLSDNGDNWRGIYHLWGARHTVVDGLYATLQRSGTDTKFSGFQIFAGNGTREYVQCAVLPDNQGVNSYILTLASAANAQYDLRDLFLGQSLVQAEEGIPPHDTSFPDGVLLAIPQNKSATGYGTVGRAFLSTADPGMNAACAGLFSYGFSAYDALTVVLETNPPHYGRLAKT